MVKDKAMDKKLSEKQLEAIKQMSLVWNMKEFSPFLAGQGNPEASIWWNLLIQKAESLEKQLKEANRKLESLARMPYFKELQKLREYINRMPNSNDRAALLKLLNQSKDES